MFWSCLARWLPSPFLRLSALVHGAALLGLLLAPAQWPLWLGLVLVNQAIITFAGLWPRSRLLGPNLTRLPPEAAARGEVALTFDDGPDPAVTPRVLELLQAHGARASFFCIAERVRQHPELVRDMLRRGHQIENHTQTHPRLLATYGPRRMDAEVRAAQATLAAASGRAPRFFRAVAGLRNPFLQPVLATHGLQLVSWTRRGYDGSSQDAAAVLARLTRGLAAGDILLLHDGHDAGARRGEPAVLAVLPTLLDALAARGLRSVTLEAGCTTTPQARLEARPA